MKSISHDKDGIDLAPSCGYEYFIGWDRIKNERDILGWVSHLSEKAWFNAALCADFIEICARKLSIKYRPLP